MIDSWVCSLLLLAQEEAPKPAPDQGLGIFQFIIPVILIMLLFQFMFNPRRRDEKRRLELLKSLKKNDRIVTIGGITGTVASISEDHQYVTIKVEDNTRIKMLASSIQSVLRDEGDKDDAGDATKSS
jgi:preprotein translocase subunit YajC